MAAMRIAIIEDNRALASGLAHRLRDPGHAVDVLHDGEAGAQFLRGEQADLIILDLDLPGMSGMELLLELRQRGDATPVLLLTAQNGKDQIVAGLDAGADDYLTKPFEFDELAARLRALSRRRIVERQVFERIGKLAFERGARRVFIEDGSDARAELTLPRRELAAFECLLDRRDRLASKTVLTDHLYGAGADIEERVVEVHVSRLRKRLAPFGVGIRSARGLGYLLEETEP